MPPKKKTKIDSGRIDFAQNESLGSLSPTPAPRRGVTQNRRQPNVDYEREAKLFAKVPTALFKRLKAAAFLESQSATPNYVDQSQIVEEALREWLDRNGH